MSSRSESFDLGGGAHVTATVTIVEPPEMGPDLDDEIYRLVYGDPEADQAHIALEFRDSVEIPRLSYLIGPAWDLVDELRGLGWMVRVQSQPDKFLDLLNGIREAETAVPYRGWIDRKVVAWCGVPGRLHETQGTGYADRAPLAICRAIWFAARVPTFKGFRNAQS